jgi:hypothetical protein
MMVKILNNKPFLLVLLLAVSYASYGIPGCGSSGGGGGSKRVTINGLVEDVIGGSVEDIRVTVFENNNRKDRDTTNSAGEFKLKFKLGDEAVLVTIEFELPEITLSRIITVTRDSEVDLDLVIDTFAPSLTITGWTVEQKRLNLSRFDELIFNETEAIFRIDGNGRKCIQANGESRIEITAESISLIDCSEGISAESFGLVILEALFDINLIAKNDGIKAKDNTVVRLSMSNNPIDNNIFITSTKENGIRASGAANVTVDPQNLCTISGAKNAINQSGTSVVDPDGCTLVVP